MQVGHPQTRRAAGLHPSVVTVDVRCRLPPPVRSLLSAAAAVAPPACASKPSVRRRRSPSTFAVCLVAEWPPPAPPCSLACALGLDQSPCSTARVLSSRLAAAELRAGMGGRGSKLPPFDGEVLLGVNPLFRFPFLCFFPLRSPLASPCRSAPPLVRLLSTPGHTTPVNPDCRNGVSCCLAGADLRIQAGQCGAVEATLHTTLVRVPALFVPLSVLRERERERERERASERARESSERVQERAIRRSSCHAKSSARQNLVGAMG